MVDEHSEDVKWRKQQIRMRALELAIESAKNDKEKGRVDIVARAIQFEDYIFRSGGSVTSNKDRDGGNS